MKKILIILVMFLAVNVNAQEIITSYDSNSLPILNEELRRNNESLRTATARITAVEGVVPLVRGGTGEALVAPTLDATIYYDASEEESGWLMIGDGLVINSGSLEVGDGAVLPDVSVGNNTATTASQYQFTVDPGVTGSIVGGPSGSWQTEDTYTATKSAKISAGDVYISYSLTVNSDYNNHKLRVQVDGVTIHENTRNGSGSLAVSGVLTEIADGAEITLDYWYGGASYTGSMIADSCAFNWGYDPIYSFN